MLVTSARCYDDVSWACIFWTWQCSRSSGWLGARGCGRVVGPHIILAHCFNSIQPHSCACWGVRRGQSLVVRVVCGCALAKLLLEPSWLGRAVWRSGSRARDSAARWVGGHNRKLGSRFLGSSATTSLRKWGRGGGSQLSCAWRGGALAKLLPRPSFGLGVRLGFLGFVPATQLVAGSGGTATSRPRQIYPPFRAGRQGRECGGGAGPPAHLLRRSASGHSGGAVWLAGAPSGALAGSGGRRAPSRPPASAGGRGAMGSRLHVARPGQPLRIAVGEELPTNKKQGESKIWDYRHEE